MKFHRIRIKNLNSLYGAQTIDFEKDVNDSSLFLIIGPTGAGKSTILDAICLALFGRTPRLDRAMGQADREVGHVMSLGTAECVAELEFSTLAQGERRRYVAGWSLRRAHSDPEGTLQRPERALTRLRLDGTAELLVSDERAKYFGPFFDEALQGLTIDDFTRSMLLAQGDFAAFLHAGDEEKASILERLTSTDEYKVIGARAAARRRELEAKQRELMQVTRDVGLSDEARAELEQEIAGTSDGLATKKETLEKARKTAEWMKRRAECEREMSATREKLEKQREELEGLAEDIERLTLDEKLSPIEADLRELVSSRDRREKELAHLEQLEKKVEAKRKETGDTREKARELEKRLEDARKRRDEAAPVLRRYEKLAERKTSALKELERSEKAFEGVREEQEKLHAKLEDLVEERMDAGRNLDALKERLSAHPLANEAHRLAYDEALDTMGHKAEVILEEVGRRGSELEKANERVEAARLAYEEVLEQGKNAAADLAPRQAVLTRTKNRLEKHLDGQSVNERRQELDSLEAELGVRVTALKEAHYVLERVRKLETDRTALHASVEALSAEINALSDEEAMLKELEATQSSLVDEIQRRLELSDQVELLNRLREELESGEPCPLCGSPLHPYCQSDELVERAQEFDGVRSEDEEQLAEIKKRLIETGQKIQRKAAKYVSRTTSLRHQESRLAEIQNQLETDSQTFAKNAEQGGFPPLEVFRLKQSDALGVALEAARSDLAHVQNEVEEFEKHASAFERARQKFDEARDEGSDEATAEFKSALDAAVARESVASQELESAQKRLDGLATEAEALFESLGESRRVEDMRSALTELRERRSRLRQLLTQMDKESNLLQKLDDKIAARREELDRVRQNHERRAAEHDERKSAAAEVDQAIGELLGERTVAELTLWSKTAKELEEQVNDRRREIERIVKDEAELEARRKATAEAAEALGVRTRELEENLKRALESMDVDVEGIDEAASSLLAPETRVRLRRRVQAARDKLGQLEESLAASTKKLEEHRGGAPDVLPESLEAAKDEVDDFEREVGEMTRSLGALEEKKRSDDETRERLKETKEELEALRKELDTWVPIAQLIGVNDGDSFKQFAQTLNLEGLVEKANSRLERLHPRYELAVARVDGAPTLDFSVVDKYQARTERPLTTLSGGETFLVSLALALALSDYRRIEFPVETLLLDEGFGTLDQDSLRMAVNTLHQLHRDGTRQIGIISHVEALKDMVDSRIIVDKTGQGRSVIRFEEGATQLAG